jgi:PAS domain S-box-containing protein
MKKTYKKTEEKLTSEGTELRQPVAELEAPATDHIQTEQLLRKTEWDKLAILNSISELVIHQDTEHRILWTNKAAVESVGLTTEQLVGRYCYEIWPQRNQPCEGCPVARARQTGKPQKAEIATPDGRTWSVRGYPILDEYDRVTGIIELVLNITERKKAEQALRESEEKYKELAESITDVFFAFDKDLKYTYWNKASEKLTGISAEDALGKHLYDIFPDSEMTREAEKVYLKALRTQQVQSFVHYYQLGGKKYFFEISAYPSKTGLSVFTRDITEREKAEQALRDSEEKTLKMLESVSCGISVVDLNSVITEVNQRTVEMHGFSSKDELVGKNAFDLVAPQDREKIAVNMGRAIKEGTISGIEYTLLKSDGSEFPAELSTSALKDASGKVIGHITVARDITERKQAEEKLNESEERFRIASQIASDVVYERNLQTGIATFYGDIDSHFGYEPGEYPRTMEGWREHVHPEDLAWIDSQSIDQMEPGVPHSIEYRMRKKDGTYMTWLDKVTVICDEKTGKPLKFLGAATDITERKQAEQALQAEKNKLQSVIDAMEDDLSIQDKYHNITYQNKPSKTNFGDHLGEKCYRAFEGRDEVDEDCPVEKAFKDGKSHISERKLVTLSGEVIYLENTANPIKDASGKIVSCLEIGRDVTERKRAAEREKELQKELLLSSRLASIGELAAGVAHQINNPLTGVLGFSQRLLKKSTDQATEQDLNRIYTEAERAAKVVQNLLTFARRRQPLKQYSDINEILESALELRAYELKTSNIEVVTDLDPKLPEIMLDFYQIQEVFLNIILNAEQALTEAHNGGKLTIMTVERRGYVRTTFTDDGPGIPAERLDNIFDPFYTTKAEKGGTGLGLSVCHGIITEHGGKIYAKSKPGKGATFFVELPLTPN